MRFMAILWSICGWFCGLICECLRHVERMVLGVVWPDFSLFKSFSDYLKIVKAVFIA